MMRYGGEDSEALNLLFARGIHAWIRCDRCLGSSRQPGLFCVGEFRVPRPEFRGRGDLVWLAREA